MILHSAVTKTIQERLNNPEIKNKDLKFTLKDLRRTSAVIISTQAPNRYASEHTKSWWADYSLTQFDYTRYLLGMERPNKTRIFNFPDTKTVEEEIFPFFDYNPVLKAYIMNQANQHNFGSAARTAVIEEIFKAGFIFRGSNTGKTTLEFRKNTDGSISVFEKFYLKNDVMHIETENTLKSDNEHTVCVLLRTCITEKDGLISHELEYFSIKSIDKSFSEQLFSHPLLSDLRQYIDREDDIELGLTITDQEDDWMLIDGLRLNEQVTDILSPEDKLKEDSESMYMAQSQDKKDEECEIVSRSFLYK